MLRIYLMGELCMSGDGRLVRGGSLPGRQGRLAFAYLVDRRTHPVTRDELAEALWAGAVPSSYELGISAVISKLRAVLDDAGIGRRALIAESGCYQLVLDPPAWIDAEAAVEAVHLAEGLLAASDPAAAYGHAVVACSILARPFLPGGEGAWIDRRREVLRTARLRALDCLAQIHSWNGEHPLALRAAGEAVELEPYRESGHRRLMSLHVQNGDPAEARRAYERLSTLLARDLGASPAPETRALLDAIAE